MADGYFRRPSAGQGEEKGPPNSTRVYVKHLTNPAFAPRETSCQDYDDPRRGKQKGCGAGVIRYTSFPNQRGMRFDGPVKPLTEITNMGDGGFVAWVSRDNFHQVHCTARSQSTPVSADADTKSRAAGV